MFSLSKTTNVLFKKYIEDELAEKIITYGMKEGDTVIVDFDKETTDTYE